MKLGLNSSIDEEAAPSNFLKEGYVIACYECGKDIKITNIDSRKMEITYFCPNCCKKNNNGTITTSLKKYLKLMNDYSVKFNICLECSKNMKDEKGWKFCTICENILCPSCIKTHINNSKANCTEDFLMNNNEKRIKCFKHPHDIDNYNTHFCHTHQTHFCNNCAKSKFHKKPCDKDELLDYDIGETEKKNFKDKYEFFKKQENNIKDDIKLKKTDLEKKLEEEKKKHEKLYETTFEKNKIDKEVKIEQQKEIYNKELDKINKEFTIKIKELNMQKDLEIQNLKKSIDSKIVNIERIFNKQQIIAKNELEKNLNELKTVFDNKMKLLNQDERINDINCILQILELIKKSYENYKENYFHMINYIFASNGFKQEDTPNLLGEYNQNQNLKENNKLRPKEDDIKINLNINFNEVNIEQEKPKIINNDINNETPQPKYLDFIPFVLKNGTSCLNKYIDNSFEVFESKNKEIMVVFSNNLKNIMIYNLNTKLLSNVGKENEHNEGIVGFRYYYDKKNNRDLIMSISSKDNILII